MTSPEALPLDVLRQTLDDRHIDPTRHCDAPEYAALDAVERLVAAAREVCSLLESSWSCGALPQVSTLREALSLFGDSPTGGQTKEQAWLPPEEAPGIAEQLEDELCNPGGQAGQEGEA